MSMEHGVWNISGRMIDHPKCNAQQLMRSPQRRLTCISSKCKIARFHFLVSESYTHERIFCLSPQVAIIALQRFQQATKWGHGVWVKGNIECAA